MRTCDYPALMNETFIHGEFDLKSLYGAFYRSPLTDIHHAEYEPKHARSLELQS